MNCLEKQIDKLVKEANFSLRADIKRVIQNAYLKEKQKKAKKALKQILENEKIAQRSKVALCQDTGLPLLFFQVGPKANLTFSFINRVEKAVAKSYQNNYLRPSCLDPLRRKNPNYGGVISHIYFSAKTKGVEITLLPKGFGSENKTQLRMFDPTVKISRIEEFVLAAVKNAGPESCPPFFIGVGIGGTSDYALYLAKKALTKKIDSSNPDKTLNSLEKRLMKKINKLGIGPMGLGGNFTALGVKIIKQPTHLAGLPVGVNVSCHALRSATIQIRNKIS